MQNQTTLPDDTGKIDRTTDRGPETPPPYAPKPAADRAPEPPEDESRPPARPLNLSLSQIAGGSLAAATAAALGSKLGVAGTIGGAALASVISAVAGSLYTASVRRTTSGVQSAFRKRAGYASHPAPEPKSPAEPDTTTSAGTAPVADATTIPTTTPGAEATTTPARRRISWKGVVGGAVAVFVLASLVIFGVEQLTGQALDGQQGSTTFSQVTHAGSSTRHSVPTSTTSAPSASAPSSSAPSTEPSDAASGQATTSPSASDQPSGTTTETGSAPAPSSEATPSASAGASSPAGSATTGSGSASSAPSSSAGSQPTTGASGSN